MRNILFVLTAFLMSSFLFLGCNDDSENPISSSFKDVKITVKFDNNKSATSVKSMLTDFTTETPESYFIAVKSVTLIGSGETSDFVIFDNASLASSEVYEFTDKDSPISLLQGEDIPEGTYSSVKLEIYYLQMNIAISTSDRGIERRNFRIYMSDDAEYEDGLHQPGDMTQINNGTEIGWLLGEGQEPNMDPVTPRTVAYTSSGDGVTWYDFAGKSAENYGPFGDPTFWSSAPQPIYYVNTDFQFESVAGQTMLIEFDVTDCWKFEDKDDDGAFGYGDLDAVNPTEWQMDLPDVSVSLSN